MFALVINYINKKWPPHHVTMGLFEVHETTMVIQLKALLVQNELLDKVITYVKDESANLNTFTMALTNNVSCDPFMLPQPYATICYGHAMFKCCQYVTNDFKVCSGMHEVPSRLLSLLYKRQLLGPRKVGRASKNGFRLVEIPSVALKNKKLLSRLDLTPK
jgi:hypothetical protein